MSSIHVDVTPVRHNWTVTKVVRFELPLPAGSQEVNELLSAAYSAYRQHHPGCAVVPFDQVLVTTRTDDADGNLLVVSFEVRDQERR